MAQQYNQIVPLQAYTATFQSQDFNTPDLLFGFIAGATALSGLGTVTIQPQVKDPVTGAYINFGSAMTAVNAINVPQKLEVTNCPYTTMRLVCTISGTSITFGVSMFGKQTS